MNFDSRFVEAFNGKGFSFKAFLGAFSTLKGFVKNFGLDYTKLISMVQIALNYDKLINR